MKTDSYRTAEPDQVREMFSELSPTYDLANRVLSLGQDRAWRRILVDHCMLRPGDSALDLCCGTGDVAFELERRVGQKGSVAGVDFSPRMLKLARARAQKQNSAIEFLEGDALDLQYTDDSFDAATIAFGIRNLADIHLGIREMARVVRPGGIVGILETGQPPNQLIAGLYRFYNRRVIPLVGGWISGSRVAYEYLHDTSSRFPCGAEFKSEMEQTGCFSEVNCKPLTLGVAYVYAGVVR